MSHRIEQLESTLARAIQEVLGKGLNDPRASGLMSVMSVSLTKDLRSATVMVSIYPEDRQELTMHAIRHAAKFIRREAGEKVALQRMPELTFKLDTSLKKQAEVFEAIRQAGGEAAPGGQTPGGQGANTSSSADEGDGGAGAGGMEQADPGVSPWLRRPGGPAFPFSRPEGPEELGPDLGTDRGADRGADRGKDS